MNGWIKTYRKVLDNPIVCKDTEYFAVWNYLLLKATHTNKEVVWGGVKITINPGQLITGRKAISAFWNIDESKVQRVLKCLEIEQQIEQRTNFQNRLITIINWVEYQRDEQQNEQRVNSDRTASEQRVNTNKKLKNVKKLKNTNTEEFLIVDPGLKSVVDFYNEIFNKKFESYTIIQKNYDYWLTLHNVDEIRRAISIAGVDTFWRDKLTLEILLRRRNPQGENVDRIGDLLARSTTSKFISNVIVI